MGNISIKKYFNKNGERDADDDEIGKLFMELKSPW